MIIIMINRNYLNMIYKCRQLLQVYQLYQHRYKKILKFYHLITIKITIPIPIPILPIIPNK